MDVKKIRKEMGLTQKEFADEFGISHSIVQKWEYGNRIPGNSVQKIIMDAYKVRTGSKPETIETKSGNKYVELPDGTYDVEVELIPFSAYASYVESYETGNADMDFGSVVFNVDHAGKGNYKAFIVKGDSMNGGKIDDTKDGAKVLGRELQKHHWQNGFHKTDYGWIILSTDNIFHKDIIGFDKETGTITCHSRNPSPEYSDFKLKLDDCYQIFKVIKRIF